MSRAVHNLTTRPIVEVEGSETGHTPHAVIRKGAAAEWNEKAAGANAVVTATKAGEASKSHIITSVTVGFYGNSLASTATVQIKSGATVLRQVVLAITPDNSREWDPCLGDGIVCAEGEDAIVTATTADGNLDCNIAGYTR